MPQPIAIPISQPLAIAPDATVAPTPTESVGGSHDVNAAATEQRDGTAVGLGFDLSTAMLIVGIVLVVTTFRIRRRRSGGRRSASTRPRRSRREPGPVHAVTGARRATCTAGANSASPYQLAPPAAQPVAAAGTCDVPQPSQQRAVTATDHKLQPPLRLVGGDRWSDDGGADLPASSMQSAEQRLVALDEHARSIICTLENRVQSLEALLDVADQRIRTLEALTDPSQTGPIAPADAVPTAPEGTDHAETSRLTSMANVAERSTGQTHAASGSHD